jgi:hypothetical protein
MLSREFKQFGVFERLHLVNQTRWRIHAFSGVDIELLNGVRLGGLLHPYPEFFRIADRTIPS